MAIDYTNKNQNGYGQKGIDLSAMNDTAGFHLSKPAVACNMFFLLDEKEPKNQDKPDPSGRFVRPFRTWVETCRFDCPRWHITEKK